MRWFVLLAVALLCGCMETQKEVQREYVCPDQRVVDSPEKCNVAAQATTTTGETTTTTLGTTESSTTTVEAPPAKPADPCEGLQKNEYSTCVAIKEGNASKCPVGGLEFRGDLLSTSVFDSYGKDIVDEGKKNLIGGVFQGNRTCVMAILEQIKSPKDCENFPFKQLCREKFIVEADNVSACEAIPQGSMQMGCYFALIRLKGNMEACVKYPQYQDCLVKAAAKSGDFGLCQRIYEAKSAHDQVSVCIADAKMERCLETADASEDCCSGLPSGKIDSCYDAKQKLSNDTLWCKKTDGGNIVADWDCYVRLAKKLKNPGVCEDISVDDQHDFCLNELIIANGNQTLCGKIKDDNKRHRCIYGTA